MYSTCPAVLLVVDLGAESFPPILHIFPLDAVCHVLVVALRVDSPATVLALEALGLQEPPQHLVTVGTLGDLREVIGLVSVTYKKILELKIILM